VFGGHEFRDGSHYQGALLTNVQLRQVEPEDLGLPAQVAQIAVGYPLSAVPEQTVANDRQILDKVRSARVSVGRARFSQGASQAFGDEEKLTAVELVRVHRAVALGHLGHQLLVAFERATQIVRDRDHPRGYAQVVYEPEHAA
jgi:hypothetical protein